MWATLCTYLCPVSYCMSSYLCGLYKLINYSIDQLINLLK